MAQAVAAALTPMTTHTEILEKVRALTEAGQAYALVTVVRAIAPTSAYVGAQAVVQADGSLHGWIGGGCTRSVVIHAAQAAIAIGQPRLVRISNDALLPEDDVEHFTMACASNGSVELFIQPYGAHSVLCVLGSTPAADEARFLAQRLRIGLTDSPGQASIILVATQGQGDEDALQAALRSSAQQVLMIASRRKAEKLRSVMRLRGIDEARLACLQAPAGPDAGAKTPGEIALLAIVGVLAWLRGRPQQPLSATPPMGDTPLRRDAAAVAGPQGGSAKPPPLPGAGAPEGSVINPVCGMAVNTTTALHIESYEGESYYFCCNGCRTTFLQDPAKYAAIQHVSIGRRAT